MKLSLIPTWTCSGPTVGDLMTLQPLLGSWSSWYDAKDPRDCLEALVDNGEAHEVLEPLMKTLMPFKVLEAFFYCLMDIVDDMANSVNGYGNDLEQLEGKQPLNMVKS